MKKIILVILLIILFDGVVLGATLTGRIIKGDGKPLVNTNIQIEGNKIKTNEFGGFKVDIADGERELDIRIEDSPYKSESIKIFSPQTKQNWKIDDEKKTLIKMR